MGGCFFSLSVLLCLCSFAVGVRDVRLVLPSAVMSGDSVRLICLFDLQGAPLYSVKWYRGQREFYRYVPKEDPPMMHFPFPGITVDLAQSDANQVKLKDIHADLSGNFSCEVTSDAPFFRMVTSSQAITVVEMADRAPVITVEKERSDSGQPVVTANCTAFHSRPPGNVTLYLNEVPVSEKELERFPVTDELIREVVRVRRVLSEHELDDLNFSLRLRCVSSVYSFTRMTEALLIEQRMLRHEAAPAAMEASTADKLNGSLNLMIWMLMAALVNQH